MSDVWILVLGLAWGNPDNRIEMSTPVMQIERVEIVAVSREECERAASEWVRQNLGSRGYSRAFATCAGRKPTDAR